VAVLQELILKMSEKLLQALLVAEVEYLSHQGAAEPFLVG
jgi:hypothetical protein